MKHKNIFITGGSRGIGRGLVQVFVDRGCQVVFSVRKKEDGEETLATLGENKNSASYVVADVTDKDALQASVDEVTQKLGNIDVLVNNAGILLDYGVPVLEVTEDSLMRTFDINVIGALRTTQVFEPLMKAGSRIINISSGMGQLSEMGGGCTAYRVSKTGLNALTKVFAAEFASKGIQACTLCPGWVQTDMGGSSANLTVEKSADEIAKVALGAEFNNGAFMRYGKVIDW